MNPTLKPLSLSLVAKAQVVKVCPGSPPVDPIKIERMENLRMGVAKSKLRFKNENPEQKNQG
jgi:hypothetical protein